MGPYSISIISYLIDYRYANGIVVKYNLIVMVGFAKRLIRTFQGRESFTD